MERALRSDPVTGAILERAPQLGLPAWYLGAGGVAQTVWNQRHGFEPGHGIKDYDLVYFDPHDLSADGERSAEERAGRVLADLGVRVDVKNEARVHQWYGERFGRAIAPYRSTEDAIATWPTTATSVGVRAENGRLVVCAPFGLADLLAMVVRPNKALVDRSVYEAKCERWTELWPRLSVVPW